MNGLEFDELASVVLTEGGIAPDPKTVTVTGTSTTFDLGIYPDITAGNITHLLKAKCNEVFIIGGTTQ